MNNQKKIEDILRSIQELVFEAQNEQKLDKLETSGVVNLDTVDQSKTISLGKKQSYNKTYLDKIQEINPIKIKNLEIDSTKNNVPLKNSWQNLNFEKCQEKSQSQFLGVINDENDKIEKIFKDSLNFWIKKNLPDIIKEETARHTKKLLEEKLK